MAILLTFYDHIHEGQSNLNGLNFEKKLGRLISRVFLSISIVLKELTACENLMSF